MAKNKLHLKLDFDSQGISFIRGLHHEHAVGNFLHKLETWQICTGVKSPMISHQLLQMTRHTWVILDLCRN